MCATASQGYGTPSSSPSNISSSSSASWRFSSSFCTHSQHKHVNSLSNLFTCWGNLHYTLVWARALLTACLVKAGAFTSPILTRFESEVSCHHHSKCILCLQYFQTTRLHSRQQLTYSGMWAVFSPTLKLKWVQLTFVPGWPSVNPLSCTQPWLCLKTFACVNVPNNSYMFQCIQCWEAVKTKQRKERETKRERQREVS